jgi:hypothetical protein
VANISSIPPITSKLMPDISASSFNKGIEIIMKIIPRGNRQILPKSHPLNATFTPLKRFCTFDDPIYVYLEYLTIYSVPHAIFGCIISQYSAGI